MRVAPASTLLANQFPIMVVSCPQCDSSYEVADDKLRGRTARMRCPACQHSWVVSGPHSGASHSQPAPASRPPASLRPSPFARAAADDDEPETSPGVTPPVSSRAARRKDDVRARKDMFATPKPEAHHGSVVESAQRGLSGERNEHSVLFTVADLKAADARRRDKESLLPPPMAAAPGAGLAMSGPSSDGAIDLLAMCSQGGQVKTRGEPLLTVDTAPSGFSISVRPPPDPRRKMAYAGAAAAGAALFLALGIGLAVRGGPEAKPEPMAAAAAPPPVAAPQAPIATPDKPADKVATTAPASEEAKPPTVSASGAGKGKARAQTAAKSSPAMTKVGASAPRGGAVSSPPPAPPKAAAKKGGADPCGCKGNLQCAMKCGL